MRALGIDYGRRRIGLAISDATGMLARPWKTVPSAGAPGRVARVLAAEVAMLAVEADGLGAVVIGLPRRLSGEPNAQTAVVQEVAAELRALIGVPVVLQDERLTSVEAESRLARTEKNWRTRKPLVDAAAAAIILQDYLDAEADRRQGHDVEPEGGVEA